MSDTIDAAPAGTGTESVVSATMQEPFTAEAAVSLLQGWDEEDAKASAEPTPASDPEDASTDADPAPEGEDGEPLDADDGNEEPDEGDNDAEDTPAEPQEPEGYDWEKVPGDAKFRLRDGTVVTGADLKQRWDDLQQATQQKEYLAREYATFQQQQAQFAQQAQQFFPVAQQAIQAIQQSLPQIPNPPDRSLLQTDPLRFHDEMANRQLAIEDYNAKVGQIQQIQGQAQAHQQRLHAEQQQRLKSYVDSQREELFKAMPDLRDTGKRQEFYRDFIDTLPREYGFKPDELNQVYDARLMRLAADAMAYRKLMSKPKPKPNAAGAPAQAQAGQPARAPMAQPGRRATSAEQKSGSRDQLRAEMRAKGRLSEEEAVAYLRKLDR